MCKHERVEMGWLEDLYCKDCGEFLGGIGGWFDSGDMPPDDILNDWWNGKIDLTCGLNSYKDRIVEKENN